MSIRWLALAMALAAGVVQAQALKPVTLVRGLSHPWGLAFLPSFDSDGRMLVTERPGRLRIVDARGQLGAPIVGLPPVDARGQGGLLDVALDPKFGANRWVYWSYSEPGGGGTNSTAVARGRLDTDGLRGRLREVQGAALHPQTGELWIHEHGPQGGDELNVSEAGRNYGWPVITYGAEYFSGAKIGEGTAKPGMEQPLVHWVPSIAPSGMAFLTSDRYPGWKGDLFIGALRAEALVRLQLDGRRVVRQERLLEDFNERIRDVRQGPDGWLYLLTDADDGRVIRVER